MFKADMIKTKMFDIESEEKDKIWNFTEVKGVI